MDKKKVLIILGFIFLAWLLLRRKSTTVQAVPVPAAQSSDPLLLAYANDPSRNEPAHYTYNVSGSNADINLGPQGLGYLDNRYIPLFGFVGMATGDVWL
jgi:hypothetical protein